MKINAELEQQLINNSWLGIVEDVNDPLKRGRVRIRVRRIYDQIPVEHIPWASPRKDTAGKQIAIPEKGKVVNVWFLEGDIHKPEYDGSEHYNINLQEKLDTLDGKDYSGFISLLFDSQTNIYRHPSNGLIIDHSYSNIHLDNDGFINLNLRDNQAKLFIGSPDPDQEAVLGTHWMAWFDDFVSNLIGEKGGPYLGNLGAPVIANPAMLEILNRYRAIRQTFLSQHVFIVDNQSVKKQKRTPKVNGQIGDAFTDRVTTLPPQEFPIPKEEELEDRDKGKDELPYDKKDPTQANAAVSEEQPADQTIPARPVTTGENGKLDPAKLTLSKWLSKTWGQKDKARLVDEAAKQFDKMMDAYQAASFSGKQTISFTDGYRTFAEQEYLFKKVGAGYFTPGSGPDKDVNGVQGTYSKGNGSAAKPGTSNHGWAIAVDLFWGVKARPYYKDLDYKEMAFSHPTYKWFYQNGPKYGWYNPATLKDKKGTDEWWHWEYRGPGKAEHAQIIYAKDFEANKNEFITLIQTKGGTYKA